MPTSPASKGRMRLRPLRPCRPDPYHHHQQLNPQIPARSNGQVQSSKSPRIPALNDEHLQCHWRDLAMTALKAVLFDIDGTLVDSNEQHVTSWALAFRNLDIPQEADAIRRQIGKGGDLLVPALLPDASPALIKAIGEQQGAIFSDAYLATVRAFPGATDLIRQLHASGLKIVLASSAKQAEIDHYIGLLGIEDMLAATTSIDDVDTSKPDPEIFSTAIEKIGVQAKHAFVVGDTIYDVEGASRAGIVTIGVCSGPFNSAELREAGAVRTFTDVADLLSYAEHSNLNIFD